MRDVIAVSGLIPHGASLVACDDSSQVPQRFPSVFLFLKLRDESQAARSHINQRRFSRLLSGSMGRERGAAIESWDYSEDEVRK